MKIGEKMATQQDENREKMDPKKRFNQKGPRILNY